MSSRRMATLIRALPEDSAVGRLHGSDSRSKPREEHVEATVIRSGEAFASWMNTKASKA